MKKAIGIILVLVIVLGAAGVGTYMFLNRGEWVTLTMKAYKQYEPTLERDLNGDQTLEKIEFLDLGASIKINDKEYLANKHYGETKIGDWVSCTHNMYYVVDLNEDGLVEIIHNTFNGSVSPGTNHYTIYNFVNNEFKEVGAFSIIGSMPDEVHVKKNKLKFTYVPYETYGSIKEEVVVKLK